MLEIPNIDLRSLTTPELRTLGANATRSGRRQLAAAVAAELDRRQAAQRPMAGGARSSSRPKRDASPPDRRSALLLKFGAVAAVVVLVSTLAVTGLHGLRWPGASPAPASSAQTPAGNDALRPEQPGGGEVASPATADLASATKRARPERPGVAVDSRLASASGRSPLGPDPIHSRAAPAVEAEAAAPRQRLEAEVTVAAAAPREGRLDLSQAQQDLERSAPRHGCSARMASSAQALCADADELAAGDRAGSRIRVPDKTDLARAATTDDRRPR